MHALSWDARLRHVPAERWARASSIVEHGWLREGARSGHVASGTCAGLVGVRMRVELSTLTSTCECAGLQPCEHVLALLIQFPPEPPAPAPPPPPEDVAVFTISGDANDPGRLLVEGDGGLVPEAAAERLRWLWWKRIDARQLAGETRTLAQACQLLVEAGYRAHGPTSQGGSPTALALFRQRALGEPIHIRVLDAASDASLALAHLLADRGARPHAGKLPAEFWTLGDECSFAGFYLEAHRSGAEVRADLTLAPKPLAGEEAQLDVGCLPARLLASPAVVAALAPFLREPAVVDVRSGHVLVPATRVVDVEEGLRALGADVCYRHLAPAGERYLEWPAELPTDLFGARPRLRAPFQGSLGRAPPNLAKDAVLAPYQKEAVAFIVHLDHTCLLADDMGLGKTFESIAAAQLVEGRVLVVCPASAREVWRREVTRFTSEAVAVLGPGDDPARIEGNEKYVVTGYSNLESMGDGLDASRFALVILDESHYIKNAATGRAKLVRERLGGIPHRLVVSGTPVMNTPEEVRAQLAFLHPDEWSDHKWFRERFSEPFEHGTPEVRDAVLRRLRQFLDGVMLRREKSEALPDLPPKRIEWQRIALAPEARRAYVALEDEFDALARADGATSAKVTGKLERLKQCALAGKMPAAIALLRKILANEEKVVVFSKYRDALASLTIELAEFGPAVLSGTSSPEERADAERRFQTDPTCRVFIGQIVAAGTALTLTAGTHAVFLDLSWNPADHRQAMDRIHRRGQTRPVTVHFLLAEGTLDEDMAVVLDEKGRMMDALLASTGGHAGGSVRKEVVARVIERRSAGRAV